MKNINLMFLMVEMMFQCLIRIGRLTQYSSISLSASGGWCDINCENHENRDKSNLDIELKVVKCGGDLKVVLWPKTDVTLLFLDGCPRLRNPE